MSLTALTIELCSYYIEPLDSGVVFRLYISFCYGTEIMQDLYGMSVYEKQTNFQLKLHSDIDLSKCHPLSTQTCYSTYPMFKFVARMV